MSRYRITVRASADLRSIGEFTQQRWGRDSRIEYLDRIHRSFKLLAANPSLGRRRDEVAEHVRTFPIGGHLIVYQEDGDDGILVIRLLHQSMDYPTDL